MNLERMKKVSKTGRIAYGILCAENYALAKFPERNWLTLFDPMWKVVSSRVIWDEWAIDIWEYYPKMLKDVPIFDAHDLAIDEDTYEKLKVLYKNIPEEFSDIVMTIRDMAFDCAYTGFNGYDRRSLNDLFDIEDILKKANVALPDDSVLEFSKFSENDGFAYPFDPTPISKILN